MSWFRWRTIVPLAAAVLWIGPTIARADSYEGFDYSSGQNLHGQSGGEGWAGAWDEPQPDPTNTQLDKVWSDGLGFPGLLSKGGKVVAKGQYNFVGRHTSDPGGVDGTSTFLSFLIRKDTAGNVAGDPDYGGLEIGGVQRVFIGSLASGLFGSDNAASGTGAVESSVSSVLGQTAFIVAQIDWKAGADTISVYVNPDPNGVFGEPNLVKADNDLGNLGQVGISTGVDNEWSVDEIHVANVKLGTAANGGISAHEAFSQVAPVVPLPPALLAFPLTAIIAGLASRKMRTHAA